MTWITVHTTITALMAISFLPYFRRTAAEISLYYSNKYDNMRKCEIQAEF